MVFVCDFLCVFAKFVQKILNLSQKLGKSHTKPSAGDARLKWMLPCSNHINFCSIKEVLCKLCKIFEKSHEKSQEYNHVLAPIVGKDWGQKFLLVFVLGVPEGLINRGSFWFSIFTPSLVQCSGHPPLGAALNTKITWNTKLYKQHLSLYILFILVWPLWQVGAKRITPLKNFP